MFHLLPLLFIQAIAWTRDDCVKVAQTWEAGNVPYSQSTKYNTKQYVTTGKGPYRSDCSGFVSAAWDLSTPGFTTRDIPHQTISSGQLIRCDALLNAAHHIALFWGWADAQKTRPIVVEEYSTGHFCEQRTWSSLRGFVPVRRNGWNADPASGDTGETGASTGGNTGASTGGSTPRATPRASPRAPSRSPPTPEEGGAGGSPGAGGSGCTVTASALNVRSCASTSCRVIRVLPSGTSVTPTGTKSGAWDQISSPVSGWVSSSYLSCGGAGLRQEAPTTTTNTPHTNAGLIAGVVVALVVCIAAVAGAAALFFIRSRNQMETV